MNWKRWEEFYKNVKDGKVKATVVIDFKYQLNDTVERMYCFDDGCESERVVLNVHTLEPWPGSAEANQTPAVTRARKVTFANTRLAVKVAGKFEQATAGFTLVSVKDWQQRVSAGRGGETVWSWETEGDVPSAEKTLPPLLPGGPLRVPPATQTRYDQVRPSALLRHPPSHPVWCASMPLPACPLAAALEPVVRHNWVLLSSCSLQLTRGVVQVRVVIQLGEKLLQGKVSHLTVANSIRQSNDAMRGPSEGEKGVAYMPMPGSDRPHAAPHSLSENIPLFLGANALLLGTTVLLQQRRTWGVAAASAALAAWSAWAAWAVWSRAARAPPRLPGGQKAAAAPGRAGSVTA